MASKDKACALAFEQFFEDMTATSKIVNPIEQMKATLALVVHFERLYDLAFNEGHKAGKKNFYYTLEKN